MIDEAGMVAHAEFWPLTRVSEITGISRSEIYRQMKLGVFPRSNSYRDAPKKRFWLSSDIKRWQINQFHSERLDIAAEIDSDFDALLKE